MREKNAIKVSLGMIISMMIIVLIILLVGGFLLYKNHVKIIQLEDIIAKQKISDEKMIAKELETDNSVEDTTNDTSI